MNWKYREETYYTLATINVIIAAFVTAKTSLKLYNYLELLSNSVLYYDTDSFIYVSRSGGAFDVSTGDFVGYMTDKLESYGVGAYITEVCKVKGIKINYSVGQSINLDSIKEMVLNPVEPIDICGNQIRRTKEHEVVIIPYQKCYKPKSL